MTALPHISLADMTAIGCTGLLVVVLPKMTGEGGCYNLVMLVSSPVFAASFLTTKALTVALRAGDFAGHGVDRAA